MTIIQNKPRTGKVEIDLSGPSGNAFALLAYAKSFGNELGLTKQEQSEITTAMMAGDYENLLQVFDAHFGEFCDLIRNTEGE